MLDRGAFYGFLLLALLWECGSSFLPQQTPTGRPGRCLAPRKINIGVNHSYRTIKCMSKPSSTALMGIKGFRAWFESQFPSAIHGFSKAGSHEEFDHVLIDINQLLHIALRKSRSDGHGLTLLMKELDECIEMATPTQSLVLAMDGPPGAAKLATQRQRRRAVVVRSTTKIKRMERMVEGLGRRKITKAAVARRKRKVAAEVRTLSITPGTAFMERAAQAILYWAWQRMANPRSPLRNVKIFFSPSTAPGEGEVKLLEWIYAKNRKRSSIAILGGDSDLVLEALIVPPSCTHDIFVLLPEGSKRYLAVSLWETTRALQRDYIHHMTMSSMMKIRTDLVVLFILNGNDYLPKLRGSSGFSKLFQTYRKIQSKWYDEGRADEAFLVDPDTLELNLEFCMAFFSYLSEVSPMAQLIDDRRVDSRTSFSPLARLNNMVDSQILPTPARFTFMDGDAGEIDADDLENGDGVPLDGKPASTSENEDEAGEGSDDQRLLKLTLGKTGSEDFYAYEMWWDVNKPTQAGRHKIAQMAIDDLLGLESSQSDLDADEVDEDDLFVTPGYDWELNVAAESKVDSYLYGLLWNLQTYQDGLCADYGYNYGKRKSPTASEMTAFLALAQEEGRPVGPDTLSPSEFSPPLSAALSCLAALPSSMKDLVPEPYSRIPEETVESIYANCVDPDDNSFDVVRFDKLCNEQLVELGEDLDIGEHAANSTYTSSDSWTVLSRTNRPLHHLCEPPAPFDERFHVLRKDRHMKISLYPTIAYPQRSSDVYKFGPQSDNSNQPRRILHSSPGTDFMKLSIEDVLFRLAFSQKTTRKKGRGGNKESGSNQTENSRPPTNGSTSPPPRVSSDRSPSDDQEKDQSGLKEEEVNVEARLRSFNLLPPSEQPDTTIDGVTAMACLNQLADAEILGDIQWHTMHPSDTAFAAFDPSSHEKLSLWISLNGGSVESDLGDIRVAQDRLVNSMPKKQVQQHIASIALSKIMGSSSGRDWKEFTFSDLKTLLASRYEKP